MSRKRKAQGWKVQEKAVYAKDREERIKAVFELLLPQEKLSLIPKGDPNENRNDSTIRPGIKRSTS